MLDIFIKPFVEIIELILKTRDPKSRTRKSARAAIRLHWIVQWMETYSKDFIEGLDILIREKRVSGRLSGGLEGLRKKLGELAEMIEQDQFGFHPGFWQVAGVYDSKLHHEFRALLGIKLQRLHFWRVFLDRLYDEAFSGAYDRCDQLFIPTDSFTGVPALEEIDSYPPYLNDPETIQALLVDSGALKAVSAEDISALSIDLQRAKETLAQIATLRDRLSDYIKAHFAFEDLL